LTFRRVCSNIYKDNNGLINSIYQSCYEEVLPLKKLFFPLIKILNTLLVLLPFLGCWFGYYASRTITVQLHQTSALIILIFCLLFYYFCHKLDGFRTSLFRIGEIITGQILSVGITDLAVYVIIWMQSPCIPNLLPGIGALLAQGVLISGWAVLNHRLYFKSYKPQKTAVIYDVRQGMETVIKAYGMENRFDVRAIMPVEEALAKLESLNDIETVFLCGIHSTERNIILKHCTYNNIKLYIIPRIGDVMMSGAERMHMFHLPILRSQRCMLPIEYRFIKRTMDIVCSGIALVVLSPVLLATAIAVRSDGGPAFYKQPRLTQDGKVFNILKFRSMCVDAEKYSGAVLSAGENDPRITKVGRFIRACRLDELPQLINILAGDMSIVGPRPERPEIAAEYEKELPEFQLRLQVKAGLTGYAQVYGKYNTTPYDKLLMDLMYISRQSILEDLSIILATLKILASKESTEGVGAESVEMTFTAERRSDKSA